MSEMTSGLVEIMQPKFSARGDTHYDPCVIGLHLCGDASGQPYTAANVPARTHEQARAMFEAARSVAECSKDEADFLCDLNLGSVRGGVEHVDDFWTNRQLWPQLVALARAPLPAPPAKDTIV